MSVLDWLSSFLPEKPPAPRVSAFPKALELVLRNEGGYVNDPNDRGGATNFGVTQRTYDYYRQKTQRHMQPVRDISRAEVEAIYLDGYWSQLDLDQFPEKLAICLFDAAANHGPRACVKLLQRSLNVEADGIIGPETLGALSAKSEAQAIKDFQDQREAFYLAIVARDPTQAKFLNGWMNRLDHVERAIA